MAKRTINPRKDIPIAPTSSAYSTQTELVHIGDKNAVLVSSQALASYQGISARDTFKNFDTNISVRDQFSRSDYEYFRPLESIPQKPLDIILSCRNAYRRVGIIRNIIDLMSDFSNQGIKLSHPNPKIQKFYREWWKKIRGNHISERFFCLFYREAVAVLKRTMGKINLNMERAMKGAASTTVLEADIDDIEVVKTRKRVIPIKYNFLNPLSLEVVGGELAQFVGKPAFALKISQKLKNLIKNPTNPHEKSLVDLLPLDIRRAVNEGHNLIPLDNNKVMAYFYKKDDWQEWAEPMIYPILDDVILLEKMKLADLSALDGAISQIRLWKIGDLDKELFPTEAAIQKLAEILMAQTGGGAFDLIWGPTLTVEEYKTNVHQFLGKEKYEPVLNSIFMGLGVPITLTGSASQSGFTNNYLSLQTLIQRLEYGRNAITEFWAQEIELVRQAMGFKQGAYIEFDRMTLKDEGAARALLIQLVDRGYFSLETLIERFGEIPEIEELRLKNEDKKRESGKLPSKAGPWHKPEKNFELIKIALQKGLVTPEQVGLSDDIPDEFLDMETPFDKELKSRATPGPVPSGANKGRSGQGRPKSSGDSKPRKPKTVKPVGSSAADFYTKVLWAKYAQDAINELANPAILSHYKKKNMRSLTTEEFAQAEKQKFDILCSLEPYQNIGINQISDAVASNSSTKAYHKLYNEFYSYFINKNDRQPNIDEERNLRAGVYSVLHGDVENG